MGDSGSVASMGGQIWDSMKQNPEMWTRSLGAFAPRYQGPINAVSSGIELGMQPSREQAYQDAVLRKENSKQGPEPGTMAAEEPGAGVYDPKAISSDDARLIKAGPPRSPGQIAASGVAAAGRTTADDQKRRADAQKALFGHPLPQIGAPPPLVRSGGGSVVPPGRPAPGASLDAIARILTNQTTRLRPQQMFSDVG